MAEDDSRASAARRRTFEEMAIAAMELPAVKAATAKLDAAQRAEEERRAALPLGTWAEDQRGCPNVVLRAALFTAGKPTKARRLFRDHPLPAAIGTRSIKYTGAQLYQYELDVWLEVVHRCRTSPAGVETDFHPYGFLKSLRRAVGKENYRQLASSLALLQATAINVVTDQDRNGRAAGYVGSLIEQVRYDERIMRWKAKLHPELSELFAPNEHTWLHLDARLDLGRNWLAKWLHGYFSSHRKPHPIGVSRLRELSGSATAELFRFRQALRSAFSEVTRVERLYRRRFEWRIDRDDLVHVVRESDN